MNKHRFICTVVFLSLTVACFANPFYSAPVKNNSLTPKPSDSADSSRTSESSRPIDSSSSTDSVTTSDSPTTNDLEISDQNTPIIEEKQLSPVRTTAGNQTLVNQQGKLRDSIANLFLKIRDSNKNKTKNIIMLLLIAFLYGIIHAAGPGHRKTIVFSLYLARKSPKWEPLVVSLLLAALHGGCAILIIFIFKKVSGSIAANSNALTIYLEGFSYLLLILTAFLLILFELIDFIRKQKIRHLNQSVTNEVTTDKSIKLIPFILSGIYPCPGSLLVLILSFTLNMLSIGIFAVIAMSLGMSIPIMISGYLAWAGRQSLFTLLKRNEHLVSIISFCIVMLGYSILFLFSLYMSWPFLLSLI